MQNQAQSTISKQNDDFRTNLSKGTLCLTRGIRALGKENVAQIIHKVRLFNNFNENNDPYGEHETSLSFAREERPQRRLVVRASRNAKRSVAAQFGAFDYQGKKIFFKIDNYDTDFLFLSPDVTNPRVTNKVLTVMLAEEY